MALIVLFLVFMIALASIAWVVLPDKDFDNYIRRIPWSDLILCIFILISFMILLFKSVELSRGEISPLPWEAFSADYRRHGMVEGLCSFFTMIIFLLWAFLIPGHYKATNIKLTTGKRPNYPYVINLLVGLLLVTPESPIYQILDIIRG